MSAVRQVPSDVIDVIDSWHTSVTSSAQSGLVMTSQLIILSCLKIFWPFLGSMGLMPIANMGKIIKVDRVHVREGIYAKLYEVFSTSLI